ncbi:MAG TPA: type II secretion system protein N [Burkholderiaceae bacterium]|nr:type II secretion system protein N [Burkholderiaceae bacterium]
MATRLLSFAIWAVVAGTAVFWLTRLLSRADPAPAHAVTVSSSASVASADLSRLFGSTRVASDAAPEPAAETRYKLIGVVAPRSAAAAALALIAVDNKPPRPVSLGGVVDGSLVLLAVNHRRAELGPAGGAATVRLELPAVPEPNRSTRAVAAMPPPAVQPPPPLPATPLPVTPLPGTAPQAGGASGPGRAAAR